MLEQTLVAHAAPTLARLKTGSLFNLACPNPTGLALEIQAVSPLLREKGVRLTVLRQKEGRYLLYLYREQELESALSDPEVRAFLDKYGYDDFTPAAALTRLRMRLRASEGFPHEIGVFLGYPLPDILGFICNEGRNCLCCGVWKVYADRDGAERTFARYRKCTEAYMRLFAEGCPLSRLTVKARGA